MKILSKLLKENSILAISSGGGHLTEMIHSLDDINIQKNDITYVVFKTPYTKETLKNERHYFIIDPHICKVKYLINFMQALFLFLLIRPKIVISTGAGIAIPMILLAKKVGSKIIFIETGARVIEPSKTGKFIYKYADLFIVQYEPLLKHFDKAKLGKLI